jgi:hypothetical protein
MSTVTLSGSDCFPAPAGGYLSIFKDGKEIFIAGVPSPVPFPDRCRGSVSENSEVFQDDEGNEIAVIVHSSSAGVDWHVDARERDGLNLSGRLDVRFEPNER